MSLSQELVFSDSSLPATMDLARAAKTLLRRAISRTPRPWPFEDRVLAWLVPSMGVDISRFHKIGGPSMDDLFGRNQLANLDKVIFLRLVDRMEKLRPGTAAELLALAGTPVADRSPAGRKT